MIFVILIFFFVVGTIIYSTLYYEYRWQYKIDKPMRDAIRKSDNAWLERYKGWNCYYGSYGRNFIALDFERNIMDFGPIGGGHRVRFSDIISAELVKNIKQTVETSGYGRTYNGPDNFLGPRNGSFSAYNMTSHVINRLQLLGLRVTLDDPEFPLFEMIFFRALDFVGNKTVEDGVDLQAAAEKFHALMLSAISRGAADKTAAPASAAPAANDNAEELRKLWDLKQLGALTETEFNRRKSLFLSA